MAGSSQLGSDLQKRNVKGRASNNGARMNVRAGERGGRRNSPARLMLAGVALIEAGVLVLLLLLGVIPGWVGPRQDMKLVLPPGITQKPSG